MDLNFSTMPPGAFSRVIRTLPENHLVALWRFYKEEQPDLTFDGFLKHTKSRSTGSYKHGHHVKNLKTLNRTIDVLSKDAYFYVKTYLDNEIYSIEVSGLTCCEDGLFTNWRNFWKHIIACQEKRMKDILEKSQVQGSQLYRFLHITFVRIDTLARCLYGIVEGGCEAGYNINGREFKLFTI